MIKRAVVMVRGGVPDVLEKDAGFELVIVDYDVDGVDEEMLDEYAGDKAVVQTFSEEEVIQSE